MSINSADGVSKKDKYRNYWVLINAFWIRLRLVKYRFVRYRFVRYLFRFLSRPWFDTDILVNILFISKTSSRRLQRNNFSPSKTTWRHLANTSWRPIGKRKIVTLKTYWTRLQDMSRRRLQVVLKTNKDFLGSYSKWSILELILELSFRTPWLYRIGVFDVVVFW